MTQAVVKRDERNELDHINKQLQEWQQKGCHLLSPVTLQVVPALLRPVVNVVQIDPDPKNKEVYPQKGGGFSLSAMAFKRLLDAMVVRWDHRLTGRTDDGRDPNRVQYKAVGKIMGLDGQWHDIFGEKEIRLETVVEELTDNYREKAEKYTRDDPQFKKTFPTDQDVQNWIREKVRQDALQMKKHMLARAQSGAMARACKSRGIRETYTADELKKPFVFAILMPALDENRADDRAYLRDNATGATQLLYPAPKTVSVDQQSSTPVTDRDIEIIDIPASSAEPQAQQTTDGSVPTKDEALRADFLAAEPKGQAEVLRDLIKRKGWTTKIDGEPEKWLAGDRMKFFDVLMARSDIEETGAAKLPF